MRAAVIFIFSIALFSTSASAQNRDCTGKSAIPYCYCIYENALDEIKERHGSDSASMRQRVEAAKKALKSCLGKGTDEVEEGIDSVSVKPTEVLPGSTSNAKITSCV